MKLLLTTILFLTMSCGQEESPSTETNSLTKSEEPRKSIIDEAKPIETKTVEATGTEFQDSGITILLSGSPLPDCLTENFGQTFYIQDEQVFKACLSTGWEIIDLQGKDGRDGVDGVNGTNGTNGVNGTNGTDGLNGTDGVNGSNGVDGTDGVDGINGTNGTNGTNGIDGNNGTNGTDGVDGINGTNGTDGVDGVDGIGAVQLFLSSDDTLVGTYLDNGTFVFDNGGLVKTLLGDGTFQNSYAYVNGQMGAAYCTFESNDCSGTCYVNNISAPISGTMKNTVFYTGSTWYKALGTESSVGSKTIRSRYLNDTCSSGFGDPTITDNYPVVTPFTLPNSLSMPLGSMYIQ